MATNLAPNTASEPKKNLWKFFFFFFLIRYWLKKKHPLICRSVPIIHEDWVKRLAATCEGPKVRSQNMVLELYSAYCPLSSTWVRSAVLKWWTWINMEGSSTKKLCESSCDPLLVEEINAKQDPRRHAGNIAGHRSTLRGSDAVETFLNSTGIYRKSHCIHLTLMASWWSIVSTKSRQCCVLILVKTFN